MSLKKAIVKFTKDNGEMVTRMLVIKSVVFHYQGVPRVETIYEVYPSEEARLRGAAPEFMSQSVEIDLSNTDDLSMILQASERIWAMNIAAPFINDFTEVDADGKQMLKVKSLADLSAEIIDVDPLLELAAAPKRSNK